MNRTDKTGYWFLIAASSIEAVLLGFLSYADYALGRLFHANQVYVWSYWSHFIGDVLMSLCGLLSALLIFRHNRWAKQVAVFFFSGVIVFVSANVFSSKFPEWWLEVSLCVLPATALFYLISIWTKADLLRVSHSS